MFDTLTSCRTRTAERTFELAQRLTAALGITRVSDITRMDRLGVPVWASVRPRGSTLRVHAGKGVTHSAARTGALMEAVEFAAVEQAALRPPDAWLSVSALSAQLPAGDGWLDLAPRLHVGVDGRTRVPALWCDDLLRRRRVAVPCDLIHPRPEGACHPALFNGGTNGLASGNTVAEATLHAVFELLERDAIALHLVNDRSAWVKPSSLPEPLMAWQRAWRRVGVELYVRQLPNVAGLPAFRATLHEAGSADVNLADGFGLHSSRSHALFRAVTEAAQSRLSTIHGGRDDVTHFFAKYDTPALITRARETALIQQLRSADHAVNFSHTPQATFAGDAPARQLAAVLRRLAATGFGTVLRRHLNRDVAALAGTALHVVKVVVPGLEHIPDTGPAGAGPRLIRALTRRG